MRWILLIIVLGLGGYAAYQFVRGPEAGTDTAEGVAHAFVQAAVAGDAEAVRNLCLPRAVASAQQTATQLRQTGVAPKSVGFKAMEADPPREGLSALVMGNVLSMELEPQGATWKIALIDLTGM